MKKATLLLIISFFTFCSYSQVKVQVFDSEERPRTENDSDNSWAKNLVVLNPTMLLGRGVLAIGYERVLHKRHSICLNTGITYRDYILELWHVHDDTKIFPTQLGQKKVRFGYLFDVSYKYYPNNYSDFDGGFYLSPGISFKQYNLDDKVPKSTLYSYTSYSEKINQDVSYSMSEAYLKIGYMYEGWWGIDWVIDLYAGLGYRNTIVNYYNIEDISGAKELYQNSNYRTNIQLKKIVAHSANISLPAIYLGAKLGVPF